MINESLYLLRVYGVRGVKINPTRKNVLGNKFLNMIVGGVNIFVTNPLPINTKIVNRLVEHYASEDSVEVPAEELLEVLKYVGDLDNTDFDSSKFSYCISALREKRPTVKYRLIVRIDRNSSRGAGTLLSPTDRKLGDKFNNDIVLTLYRVLGDVEKGWYGHPLWIPNIKFPDNTCFYNTTD